MKKRILFTLLLLITSFSIVNAEANVFSKTFETQKIEYGKTNYNALYKMDNLAFNDTILTINFSHENELSNPKCENDYCLIITQYDKKGNILNELYLTNVINYIAPVVIEDNLYIVVTYGDKEKACRLFDHQYIDCESNFNSQIEKYDINLKRVKSLKLDENFDTWSYNITNKMNAMFVGPYCSGQPSYLAHSIIDGMNCELLLQSDPSTRYYPENFYNDTIYEYFDFYQIHEENDKIIIWSILEDIVIDKNLTSYTTRDNTWKEKYGDGNDYSFNLSDNNNILKSGTITEDEDKYIAFLSENDKEIYRTEDYYTFMFPIKVEGYYIVLGLAEKEESDIIIIDSNGKAVQTISGNYWNLRKIDNGIAVTDLGTSVYQYFGNVSENQVIKTDVYCPFIIETKTDNNGDIAFTRYIEGDKEYVKFLATPKEGYVIGEIKVTDSDGNIINFNNYTFVMPNANVLIESKFIPENPNTKTFITYITIIIFEISLLSLYLLKQKSKKNKIRC